MSHELSWGSSKGVCNRGYICRECEIYDPYRKFRALLHPLSRLLLFRLLVARPRNRGATNIIRLRLPADASQNVCCLVSQSPMIILWIKRRSKRLEQTVHDRRDKLNHLKTKQKTDGTVIWCTYKISL